MSSYFYTAYYMLHLLLLTIKNYEHAMVHCTNYEICNSQGKILKHYAALRLKSRSEISHAFNTHGLLLFRPVSPAKENSAATL